MPRAPPVMIATFSSSWPISPPLVPAVSAVDSEVGERPAIDDRWIVGASNVHLRGEVDRQLLGALLLDDRLVLGLDELRLRAERLVRQMEIEVAHRADEPPKPLGGHRADRQEDRVP